MTHCLLSAKGVCYTPRATPLIHQVSLTLQSGTITTLIGPNGAGKTTLLKLLLGLYTPTSGVIQKYSHLRMAYMPQRLPIPAFMPLTVRDFLNLTPSPSCDTETQFLNASLHIHDLLSRSMHHLSGGELQKVLFYHTARGATSNHILILDEPTQGVDMGVQRILYETMHALRQRTSCAILMVSHDIHTVMAYCDHVICLNKHICCHGHPQDIQNHPEYRGLFAGHMPSHIAPYHHDHDHIHDGDHLCK